MTRLNLGCGKRLRDGWVNVDIRDTADLVLDVIRDPWPWEPGTVDAIESYHLIEHLTERDGAEVLRRSFDALRPGGTIALEFPDLEALATGYAKSRRKLRRQIYGRPERGEFMAHRWGYCGPTMTLSLMAAGFKGIRVMPGTDYHIAEGPCLRVEAVKP